MSVTLGQKQGAHYCKSEIMQLFFKQAKNTNASEIKTTIKNIHRVFNPHPKTKPNTKLVQAAQDLGHLLSTLR